MRFAANVLESGCGLYSYFSSGKSSAMMISFRPMSFHCSSTACEGLGAGFGGSFFAASCASTGSAANPAAKTTPPTHFSFFMFSFLRYVPTRSGRSLLQTHHSAGRFPQPAMAWGAVPGSLRGFILRSKIASVMQNSQPRHGKLVFCAWGRRHCELGLSAASHCHRFMHFDSAVSLAAFLVPRPLARHVALGAAPATSRRTAGLCHSSPAGHRHHVSRLGPRPWRLRPPKLRHDRDHRPLVFQRTLLVSFRPDGSRLRAPLAIAARCNSEGSPLSAHSSPVHANLHLHA